MSDGERGCTAQIKALRNENEGLRQRLAKARTTNVTLTHVVSLLDEKFMSAQKHLKLARSRVKELE